MSNNQVWLILEIYGIEQIHLLILIPVFALLLFILSRFKLMFTKPKIQYGFGVLVATSFIISFSFPLKEEYFESELNFHIAANKTNYFQKSYSDYQVEKAQFTNSEIGQEIRNYNLMNNKTEPVYSQYPFFIDAKNPNILGDFFESNDTSPNIVFIICESLGKQFSGPGARLGSFTPFLDSLGDHSLYWENILANAERTFGAIPNLMAGVPEGENGFLNLRSDMPNHLSLPLLLKEKNTYQTGFFCGAITSFDHMDDYLMFQEFDHIYGKKDFGTNKIKHELIDEKGQVKHFNWGAEDDRVFSESIAIMDTDYLADKPYFNLYLTTSFHEPFAYSNEAVFIDKATARIAELNPENKSDYLKEVKTFAALMYTDNALRIFFDSYQRRADFTNTIFVICGDHSIKFMSENSRLEKYHVPLIIYSPLLKRTKHFKSVASHKDVPSALQALLRENFHRILPEFSISQSSGLDTLSEFSMIHSNHVLMYADKRMNNYVYKNYLLSDGILFRITKEMTLERVENESLNNHLKHRLLNYKIISNHVCKTNTYLPDSIYQKYNRTTYVLNIKNQFDKPTGNLQNYFERGFFTSSECFSTPNSITNNGVDYFHILKDLRYTQRKCLRLKIKFKLKSDTENYPTLYIYRRALNSENEYKDFEKMEVHLESANSKFVEANQQGWYQFEAFRWLTLFDDISINQSVGIFLATQPGRTYFIDDLEIEIREF